MSIPKIINSELPRFSVIYSQKIERKNPGISECVEYALYNFTDNIDAKITKGKRFNFLISQNKVDNFAVTIQRKGFWNYLKAQFTQTKIKEEITSQEIAEKSIDRLLTNTFIRLFNRYEASQLKTPDSSKNFNQKNLKLGLG